MASDTPPPAQTTASPPSHLRRRLFTGLAGVVAVAAVGYGVWWLLIGSHHVTTENAYVGADVAVITPQTASAVRKVRVSDTQEVKAGDVLVELDPADALYPLAQATADYDRTVRRVRGALSTTEASAAQTAAKAADLKRAKAQLAAAASDLARAKLDAARREALGPSGAVSGEELSTARTVMQDAEANYAAAKAGADLAKANLQVARAQGAAQSALTQGVKLDDHPDVKFARAQLDVARLNYERTVIRAPVDGVIAKRTVQVGQRVAIGAPLMSVVPVARAYVDANFKEVQLSKVHPGQSVVVVSDLYGGSVKYHGKVVGIGGGTGAAFAIIPAQNASGNWIKVVQRLPVRIALDPAELARHPLRVGLSVKADIDTASDPQG
jgi:membrane fusion protein (multidrug efflux system)